MHGDPPGGRWLAGVACFVPYGERRLHAIGVGDEQGASGMTNRSGPRWRRLALRFGARQIVASGMLGGIVLFLAYTGLGVVPVPSLVGNATILHVPAILAGALEGPVVGVAVGVVFGVYSWAEAGPVVILRDPLVSVLPRLVIGVVAWAAFAALRTRSLALASAAAGVLGSLANTAGVLGMAVILGYLPPAAVVPVIPQAAAEAALAAVVTVVVVRGVELVRGGWTTAPEEAEPPEGRRYLRALKAGGAPGRAALRHLREVLLGRGPGPGVRGDPGAPLSRPLRAGGRAH